MSANAVRLVSASQYFWLVQGSLLAGGLELWPGILGTAGADWLWALLACAAVTAGVTRLQLAWGSRTPGTVFFDHLRAAWGGLAWPWYGGMVALTLAVDCVLLALFSDWLQTFFFPNTPALALRSFLLPIAAWMAISSVNALARNVRLWLALGLGSFAVTFAVLLLHSHVPAALAPAWPPATSGTLSGLTRTWFAWADAGAALTLSSSVQDAKPGVVARRAVGAVAAQVTLVLVVTLMALMAVGPWAPRTQLFPAAILLLGGAANTTSFARFAVIVMLAWSSALVSYLAVRMFVVSANLRAAFGGPRSWQPWYVALLALVLAVGSWRLPAAALLLPMATHDLSPIVLIWIGSLHALTAVLVAARGRRRPLPSLGTP